MQFSFIFSWNKFDDNYVTQISSNEVISSAAYILFYVRNWRMLRLLNNTNYSYELLNLKNAWHFLSSQKIWFSSINLSLILFINSWVFFSSKYFISIVFELLFNSKINIFHFNLRHIPPWFGYFCLWKVPISVHWLHLPHRTVHSRSLVRF